MRDRTIVLTRLLASFVQRRDDSILRQTLPPRHEYVIPVRLTPWQERLYVGVSLKVYASKARDLRRRLRREKRLSGGGHEHKPIRHGGESAPRSEHRVDRKTRTTRNSTIRMKQR